MRTASTARADLVQWRESRSVKLTIQCANGWAEACMIT
jgi:hypothetical protein